MESDKSGALLVHVGRVNWRANSNAAALAPAQVSSKPASAGGGAATAPAAAAAASLSTSAAVSLWAAVALVRDNGQSHEDFWLVPASSKALEDDTTFTKIVLVPRDQSVNFNYSHRSKLFGLTKPKLLDVMKLSLAITLYAGTTRSRTTDQLLGEKKLPLVDIITTASISQEVSFRSSPPTASERVATPDPIASAAEDISVMVSVEANTALADFALGCRLLRFESFEISNLPAEWIPSCASEDDAIKSCLPSEKPSSMFELEVSVPRLDGSDSIIVAGGGRLMYVPKRDGSSTPVAEAKPEPPPPTPEAKPTSGRPGAGGKPAEHVNLPPVKKPNGTWSVVFPYAPNAFQFFLKHEIAHFRDLLETNASFAGNLKRTAVETNGKHQDFWTYPFQLQLHDLLLPGKTYVSVKAPLRVVQMPSAEYFEEELSKATSNEEKKKFQALINDFPTALTMQTTLTSNFATCDTGVLISLLVQNSPLVPELPAISPASHSISDVIPKRNLADEADIRSTPEKEFEHELRAVIWTLLHEYDELFTDEQDDGRGLTRDEKKQKLVFRLNTHGFYHAFKEKLKKRIVPILREQIARPSEDEEQERTRLSQNGGLDGPSSPEQLYNNSMSLGNGPGTGTSKTLQYNLGRMYTHLMDQVHAVLHEIRLGASDTSEISLSEENVCRETQQTLEIMRLKTLENEINGNLDKAERVHLDRVLLAEEKCTSEVELMVGTWHAYALFCLRQRDKDKAASCLRQCLSLDAHALEQKPLLTYGALLCDLGDYSGAQTILKNGVYFNPNGFLGHALLAFCYHFSGQDLTGNLEEVEVIRAEKLQPTTASSIWIGLAQFVHTLRLDNVASKALEVADQTQKVHRALSVEERVQKRRVQADLCADKGDVPRAMEFLREALELDESHPLIWFVMGKVRLVVENKPEMALECFERALGKHHELPEEFQLALYLNLGNVLLQCSRFGNAKQVLLQAIKSFPLASTWLGVGIAALRQESFEEAEQALAEANVLDKTNADVWGYLALLCLNVTPPRIQDATNFLKEALRYELSDSNLLRELSNGCIAIDQLETAERLLRLTLVQHDSSVTRKTLADVLSAQNCAEEALAQYKQSLATVDATSDRCELLEQCARLLVTLGRQDEAHEYRVMAHQLSESS